MKTLWAIAVALTLVGCNTTPKEKIVYETKTQAVVLDETYFITPTTPLPPEKQEMIEAKTDRARIGVLTVYVQELIIHIKSLKAQIQYIRDAELKAKQTLEKE